MDDSTRDEGFDAIATFDGDESEYGRTRTGERYLMVRGVEIDTGQEIVVRTVMAFGSAITNAERLLHPGRPTPIRLRDAGTIMKVVEDVPHPCADAA